MIDIFDLDVFQKEFKMIIIQNKADRWSIRFVLGTNSKKEYQISQGMSPQHGTPKWFDKDTSIERFGCVSLKRFKKPLNKGF